MYVATLLESDYLDIKLDDDGDLFVDEDGIHLISGLPGVAQLIRIAVRLFRGEVYWDLTKGVAYFETSHGAGDGLLGEKFTKVDLRDAISEAVMGVPAVVSITSLTIDIDESTRETFVNVEVKTQFGDLPPATITIGVPRNA